MHQHFFFFSSRRRHTRSLRDWSSDVCSSDLLQLFEGHGAWSHPQPRTMSLEELEGRLGDLDTSMLRRLTRSEERRVGKEGRARRSPDPSKTRDWSRLHFVITCFRHTKTWAVA